MRTTLILLLSLTAAQVHAQHAAIDSVMARFNRTDAPGGAVTVVERGEVTYQKGHGMASLEQGIAIRPETIFDIGSVSKQFTGFALAMLDAQGALSLDDDIRLHLPEVPDFGHTITIRHLLNHTSGLREIYDSKGLAGWKGGDGIEQFEALRMTRHMTELNFVPGTEYLYCNTGYMLAADIVTRVTGQAFPEWLQRHVLEPLGMDSAEVMDHVGEVIVGAADSYSPQDGMAFVRRFDNSSAFGQGGIYASGSDMAKWMANMGSMRVGGQAVFDRLTTRGVLASGDTLSYALGISVREHRGATVWMHTGASAGFRSVLAWFPDHETGVFVQGNRSDFGSVARLWAVVDAVLGDRLDAAETARTPSPEAGPEPATGSPNPDAFVGRFLSDELQAVYEVALDDGQLILSHRRHGDLTMEPRGGDAFNVPGFAYVVFERSPAGGITGFRASTSRARNVLFRRIR
ncbi:MAG: serine hydrolase [Rhodothermales bacterium]|nr:serine hydrolase [Rhodothermales bacterium]MBO6778644.1 serine hydrolase [Rhodothermales bacterium]